MAVQKLAVTSGTLGCELLNLSHTSKPMLLVSLLFAKFAGRARKEMGANFANGTLGQHQGRKASDMFGRTLERAHFSVEVDIGEVEREIGAEAEGAGGRGIGPPGVFGQRVSERQLGRAPGMVEAEKEKVPPAAIGPDRLQAHSLASERPAGEPADAVEKNSSTAWATEAIEVGQHPFRPGDGYGIVWRAAKFPKRARDLDAAILHWVRLRQAAEQVRGHERQKRVWHRGWQ